jgi:ribonuclease P protein component
LHGSQILPKNERLQCGHQFRAVYERGRKSDGRMVVLYVLDLPGEAAGPGTPEGRAIGVVASRKVGGAVARNRARRLLREAYRLNKQKLKTNLQIVMIARHAINGKRFQDVEAEVLRLFQAAGILNQT